MEAALPTLAGLLWGVYLYFLRPSLADAISAFAIAFFFVVAIQGQILRVAKNVRDEVRGESFEDRLTAIEQGVERGFDSVQQGLEALREKGLVTEQPEPEHPPETPPQQPTPAVEEILEQVNQPSVSSEQQFAGAKAALQMQMWYPAVLMAAVAFDRAVAETAERIGMPYSPNMHNVLRNLAATERLDLDQIETLQTLRKFRNSLVHSRTKNEIRSHEEAREIVDAFEAGAQMLRRIPPRTSTHF